MYYYLYKHVCMFMILAKLYYTRCRLLEEVDEVLGDRQTVTADDLEGLKYTEQVFIIH